MKVIHILHSLKFSGAEIMYVDAASFFQEKGCELTVMATAEELGDYAPYFERAGYNVLHYPFPPLKRFIKLIMFYITMLKLLKKEKYDLVHIHGFSTMWVFAFCAWLLNIKSVYTFHSLLSTRFTTYPYHLFKRWTAKSIFKCKFQTISDTVYDHELKLFHNETYKIYNWYADSRYYAGKKGEKELFRKELNIDSESLVFISIGGCNSNKRHSEIIKALDEIQKEIPNCLYLHLGSGISESDEIQLADQIGLNNQIRFCGNQIDVRKYLIASDVYMMTSCYEGISITTIEAMACQIPTILYDVPGLRDFNKNGNNCILITEDYHALAAEVIRLFNDSEMAFEMAERAKMSVVKLYNMQNNAGGIYNLYL